jgi:hypothetical protein
MTPYEIELLLNIHCSPAALPQADTPLLGITLRGFENEDLIKPSTFESGWETTLKEFAFVEMLCDTPLPKQVWIDPRSDKIVETKDR